ncbi:PREDICTED: probable methyltransferase BTM2 homolog [Dufourea novaeangliae]|uniref:probable methyltransferase BTM2 homolog n=1 Tax=Dufourea novaeangliae TaxID=178035 RepID=UPI000767741B|nr:PREDICTED: probable methyltransferase BTM2 homolog [Dufourea novaeangliae]
MATEEHKYLADVIKTTHATLREEAQNYGPEIAWKRHVTRKDVLQKYASSMQKLATTYWLENNLNTKHTTLCRVEWIKSQCEEYFLNGGIQKYDDKEENIKTKINADIVENENSIYCNSYIRNVEDLIQKITLLDVGSCYNPFGTLNIFEVTAIDLNGVPEKVLHCDFLNAQTGKEQILLVDKQQLLQLPEKAYNVVVFSLFLEYLPCPKQRYTCCKKAYNLLQYGGILFIISPDSKHVGANARLMKSWRYVLSKLGFMRIKYEKLRHIHCMIFRKSIYKQVAIRWANMQTLPENDPLYQDDTAIYIPQDFRNISSNNKHQEKEETKKEAMTCMFHELPFEEP